MSEIGGSIWKMVTTMVPSVLPGKKVIKERLKECLKNIKQKLTGKLLNDDVNYTELEVQEDNVEYGQIGLAGKPRQT